GRPQRRYDDENGIRPGSLALGERLLAPLCGLAIFRRLLRNPGRCTCPVMFVAACLAAHRYWHLGKRFKNDGVGVEPGRNRPVRTWTSSEDRRHAAVFYGAVQRYSSVSKSNVHILRLI